MLGMLATSKNTKMVSINGGLYSMPYAMHVQQRFRQKKDERQTGSCSQRQNFRNIKQQRKMERSLFMQREYLHMQVHRHLELMLQVLSLTVLQKPDLKMIS